MTWRWPEYGYLPGTHPSAKQAEFHAADQRFRYLVGGYGSGKSHGAGRETWQLLLENAEHRSAIESQVGSALTPYRYVLGAPNYDKVETGPWATSNRFLDEITRLNGFSLVDRSWDTSKGPKKIRLINGDEILFVVTPGKFAGGDAAGVWYDECELATNPVSGWMTLLSRLRDYRALHLFGLASSTPPVGERGLQVYFDEQQVKEPQNYFSVRCKTSDNPIHASGEYEAQLRSTMSEREAAALLDGEMVPDDGVVFSAEYDPKQSLVFFRGIEGRCRVAIDWGGHYHALLIDHRPVRPGMHSPEDTDIVFDEVIMENCQDDDFIAAINDRLRRWGIEPRDVDLVVCDHNPQSARIKAYQAWRGRVQSRRINSTEEKTEGIETVRWRLKSAERDERGRPVRRLFFSHALRKTPARRRILKCMSNYTWKKRVIDGEQVVLPTVDNAQVWSHGADALRYYTYYCYSHLRMVWKDAAAR
jgi:hypothetical protein